MFQPRRGVASPPQPPPFLTGLIFHFSWSSSSSNICFFFPPVSPGGGFVDVRTQSAASACRSVRRVHGAVTSLLLLFLLQEELLQRRRARLHHGARPDRLEAVEQHGGGRLLHRRLLTGPGAARRSGLVPAVV